MPLVVQDYHLAARLRDELKSREQDDPVAVLQHRMQCCVDAQDFTVRLTFVQPPSMAQQTTHFRGTRAPHCSVYSIAACGSQMLHAASRPRPWHCAHEQRLGAPSGCLRKVKVPPGTVQESAQLLEPGCAVHAVHTDCDQVLLSVRCACEPPATAHAWWPTARCVVLQEAAQVRDELKEVVMQQMEEAIAKTSSTAVTHGIKVCAKRCAGLGRARLRRLALSAAVLLAQPAVALKPLSHTGTRASTLNWVEGLLRSGKWPAECMPVPAKDLYTEAAPSVCVQLLCARKQPPRTKSLLLCVQSGRLQACLCLPCLLQACLCLLCLLMACFFCPGVADQLRNFAHADHDYQ